MQAGKRTALAVLLILLGFSGAVSAEDPLTNLSESLIRLRGEVEELNGRLQEATAAHRDRMQSLERQRGELEAQLKRDQVNVEKLSGILQANREEAEGTGAGAGELIAVLLEAIEVGKERIREGLPFKTPERTGELDEIARQVEEKLIPPHQGVNRLWAFFEDEIRMTRENGIYRQPVAFDGEERLASVARLGMVMLFFESSDGKYGAARRQEGLWGFDVLSEQDDIERVAVLFDSLRKQIRTGYFTLPNVLPAGETGQQ